jgi:hypothetical protein
VTAEVNEIYPKSMINPLEHFTYALKSPESQRQYPGRFKVFLDFLGLGTDNIEEQSRIFLLKSKDNPLWAEEMLMRFCNFQKNRAEEGEISKSYEYKPKSIIKRKLSKLLDKELPLVSSLFPNLNLDPVKTPKHFAPSMRRKRVQIPHLAPYLRLK